MYRLPDKYRRRIVIPGDDFLEAHTEGSDDPRVINAMEKEVDAIADKFGGDCMEWGTIGQGHVPFEELFEPLIPSP